MSTEGELCYMLQFGPVSIGGSMFSLLYYVPLGKQKCSLPLPLPPPMEFFCCAQVIFTAAGDGKVMFFPV